MTDAPEKMWVFPKKNWFNAGASNVRISSSGANDVEYTRSDIAQGMQAENARLRWALQRMVYETTHLSPQQDDGSHWCKISHGALAQAREVLLDEQM
jgi:hypothetical protein